MVKEPQLYDLKFTGIIKCRTHWVDLHYQLIGERAIELVDKPTKVLLTHVTLDVALSGSRFLEQQVGGGCTHCHRSKRDYIWLVEPHET